MQESYEIISNSNLES